MSIRNLLKCVKISGSVLTCMLIANVCQAQSESNNREEENKRIALAFYDDLWFTNNTDKYDRYVADTYVVHDIGERKNVTELAIEQKNTADFFWKNGTMAGDIDYQIAEGNLVATRLIWKFKPTTLLGRLIHGRDELPVINVFRFENGKIVEIWNHRHDIDSGQTLRFTIRGLLFGLLIAMVPLVWAVRLRRRLKRSPTSG